MCMNFLLSCSNILFHAFCSLNFILAPTLPLSISPPVSTSHSLSSIRSLSLSLSLSFSLFLSLLLCLLIALLSPDFFSLCLDPSLCLSFQLYFSLKLLLSQLQYGRQMHSPFFLLSQTPTLSASPVISLLLSKSFCKKSSFCSLTSLSLQFLSQLIYSYRLTHALTSPLSIYLFSHSFSLFIFPKSSLL